MCGPGRFICPSKFWGAVHSAAGSLSGIDIPDAEIAYLALVISSNSTSYDYSFAEERQIRASISETTTSHSRAP